METVLTVPADAEIKETVRHYYWHSGGILFCVMKKPSPDVNIEQMKDIMAAFAAVKPGEKLCMLTDVSYGSTSNKQVREYAAKELPKIITAYALVSTSPVGRVIASLFLAVKPQPFPSKIFATEKEAMEWLQQYL